MPPDAQVTNFNDCDVVPVPPDKHSIAAYCPSLKSDPDAINAMPAVLTALVLFCIRTWCFVVELSCLI